MLLLTVAIATAPAVALAQHAGHAAHASPSVQSRAELSEGGQAAFSAIAEVVAALEADSSTDWSRVDIEGLRRHLVDMNNAVLATNVRAAPVEGGARFVVTGSPSVAASVRRMAAAHAHTMSGTGGWTYKPREIPGGVEIEITGARPDDAVRIRALGFAGILARGSHHQAHHLAIASGARTH
jgi:hypothetical protein